MKLRITKKIVRESKPRCPYGCVIAATINSVLPDYLYVGFYVGSIFDDHEAPHVKITNEEGLVTRFKNGMGEMERIAIAFDNVQDRTLPSSESITRERFWELLRDVFGVWIELPEDLAEFIRAHRAAENGAR